MKQIKTKEWYFTAYQPIKYDYVIDNTYLANVDKIGNEFIHFWAISGFGGDVTWNIHKSEFNERVRENK